MQEPDRAVHFVRLFNDCRLRLRAFAVSLVLNVADAEDVFQAASLVLWEKFDEFELGTNFMAWAGRIVFLKAQQHRQLRDRDLLTFGDSYIDTVAREAMGDDAVFERDAGEVSALGKCVGQLNHTHREMLRVRYVEGIRAERMGQLFGRSATAVRITLCRIRKTLYECLGGRPQMEEKSTCETARPIPPATRPPTRIRRR